MRLHHALWKIFALAKLKPRTFARSARSSVAVATCILAISSGFDSKLADHAKFLSQLGGCTSMAEGPPQCIGPTFEDIDYYSQASEEALSKKEEALSNREESDIK
jgi:hypothetical protein